MNYSLFMNHVLKT